MAITQKDFDQIAALAKLSPKQLYSAIKYVIETEINREAERDEKICSDAFNDAMADNIYGSD
jgi:hypothetical protein